MYRLLPAQLLGFLLLSSMTISTILFGIPIFVLAIVKFAVPHEGWRHWWTQALVFVAESWIRLNNLMETIALPTRFVVRGGDDPRLRRDGRYLVASNHQTWSDVLVLQRALTRYIPFLRFFIKQELIYVPVLGFAWWALDMPFMKRYSPDFVARHPELRGKDVETTRRACDRFRTGPISIMNFAEGTRFSPEKRDKFGSPHRNLLKPKAGGLAAVLDALSGDLHTLVDVTIAYSKPNADFWDLMTGKIRCVIVDIAVVEILDSVRRGDYGNDEAYRERVQSWVRELWESKDVRVGKLAAEATAL